ncbi:AP endonuclease, family 2 protein [Gracilibacillus halophilus YIM-C55.5]|uniref:AP endonuclease, family 2 protein n=1 Tax=Gracilibacillus halophilus YIM-C55.5 TaxID=1308866 RepID=N4WGI3_9BACI|nr:TIM barrel protein [Gracilibacillus halophilus]ENH98369.1 AP endonuclease, family 2 protein [Gracilibacillus halophilus YIM-C55.5]
MKLGLCSITFRDRTPEQIIDVAKQADLDAIEWGGDIHVPPGEVMTAKHVRQMTEANGLTISSYGSYYRAGFASENNHDFLTILDTAVALGAPSIRIWAGMYDPEDASPQYRSKVVTDTKRMADIAQQKNIAIHFESHGGTLTRTKASARQLMEDVSHPNVFLYWQPAIGESVKQRLVTIDELHPWISNVHIFHWTEEERLPLSNGMKEWKQYLRAIESDGKERYVLLEFVKNDDVKHFMQDAATLHKLKAAIES